MEEYIKEYHILMKRCGLDKSRADIITTFVNGLNYDIVKRMGSRKFMTLQEAFQAAFKAETSCILNAMLEELKSLKESRAKDY